MADPARRLRRHGRLRLLGRRRLHRRARPRRQRGRLRPVASHVPHALLPRVPGALHRAGRPQRVHQPHRAHHRHLPRPPRASPAEARERLAAGQCVVGRRGRPRPRPRRMARARDAAGAALRLARGARGPTRRGRPDAPGDGRARPRARGDRCLADRSGRHARLDSARLRVERARPGRRRAEVRRGVHDVDPRGVGLSALRPRRGCCCRRVGRRVRHGRPARPRPRPGGDPAVAVERAPPGAPRRLAGGERAAARARALQRRE